MKTKINWKTILTNSYIKFVDRRYLTSGLIFIGIISFYTLPKNRVTQLESMSKSNLEWVLIYLVGLILLIIFFYTIQKISQKYHKKAKESLIQAFDLVKGNIKALQGLVIIGSTVNIMDLFYSNLFLHSLITTFCLFIVIIILCYTETMIEELVTNKIGKCIT